MSANLPQSVAIEERFRLSVSHPRFQALRLKSAHNTTWDGTPLPDSIRLSVFFLQSSSVSCVPGVSPGGRSLDRNAHGPGSQIHVQEGNMEQRKVFSLSTYP